MPINANKELQKLTVKDTKIVFSHLNDPKFGSQITVTLNPDQVNDVTMWYTNNNFNKVPYFKEYTNPKTNETSIQFTIKLSKFLTFVTPDGAEKKIEELTNEDIAFGTKVSFIAYAYEYKNNFGEGVTSSITILKSLGREKTQSRKSIDIASL